MGFMLFMLLKNETKYTHTSVKNLIHTDNTLLQLNAVEVLGQKGHRNSTEILTRTLRENNIDDKVKIKIIETLASSKDTNALIEIIDCLQSTNTAVRIAALKAIQQFYKDKKIKGSLLFSNYRINEILKELFSKEEDNLVKAHVISILAKLRKYETVPFILDILKTANNRLKADCILVCKNFDDINLAHYLMPYLEDNDPKIKANTIAALWQFKKYRMQLLKVLKELIGSKEKDKRLAGFWVVGDIKAVQEKNRLKQALNSNDQEERYVAAIALAKLGCKESLAYIVNALMSENEKQTTIFGYVRNNKGRPTN